MKKFLRGLSIILMVVSLFMLIAVAIAGLIGYNRAETSQQINMHAQYDEVRDTEISLVCPADLRAGQEFNFSGRLVDKQTGEGLTGKQVFVRFEGSFDPQCGVTTDANGYFGGQKVAPVDCKTVETFKAVFAGD